MTTLLSFGEVLIDLLPVDAKAQCFNAIGGGAPANVAVAYAKLGGSSYFAGGISDDHFGEMLQQQLADYGVDTRYAVTMAGRRTALVLVTLDNKGERSFTFYREHSADLYFAAEHFAGVDWQDIEVFHFCSNTLTEQPARAATLYGVQQASVAGKLVSFDVNLRCALWHDVSALPDAVAACYRFADILKFSRDELNYLAAATHMDVEQYQAYCLAQGVTLILVTDGAKDVIYKTAQLSGSISPKPVRVVDTTAAGDSFIASFLYAISRNVAAVAAKVAITENEQILSALDFALSCSGKTCQQKGAFPALPCASEL